MIGPAIPVIPPIPAIPAIGGSLGIIIGREVYSWHRMSQLQKALEHSHQLKDHAVAFNLISPLALVAIGSVGSRVAAGGLGLMAQGSSMLANKMGYADFAEKLDHAEESLKAFAFRQDISTELKLAGGSTILAACAVALPTLIKGFPQQPYIAI